ncbi:membrane protein [Cnuibacter physcomitrellae]|uniref:Uncharacterized protein n=1 Tax=Cnuibacter physcomitrellae TaxID=1619308 RepID=A0A1X9LQJ6_9MICO|nr:DUF2156 domain-containing protein [Cnuibacter physcomitrellae]ARJ04170.1 hypothetical protein B5808_02205 [Cnuibacter physcomitrellae]GGI40422.1 membrane protein [Cnuibacter physcomitrellae]
MQHPRDLASPSVPAFQHLTTLLGTGLPRWARMRPVTITILSLTLLLSLSGFLLSADPWGWDVLDTGEASVFGRHQWWSPITSTFVATDWLSLIALVPLLLLVVGESERLLGSWRTAVAWVVGGVASTLLGFAASWLIVHFLEFIPLTAPAVDATSPGTGIVCVAMAASYRTNALWRRRIRLASTLFTVTLVLYSGAPGDLFALIAVPVGLVLGAVLGGRRTRFRVVKSSHHEVRVLLASLVAISVVGPVVAASIGWGTGLFSIYGYLSYDSVSTADGVACAWGSDSIAGCPDGITELDYRHPWAGMIAILPVLVGLVAAWGILKGRRAALWLGVALELVVFLVMLQVTALLDAETRVTLAEQLSLQDANTVFVWQIVTSSVVCTAAPLAVAMLLVLMRRHVQVAGTGSAVRSFAVTAGGSVAAAAVIAVVGQLAFADHYRPAVDVGAVLSTLPSRLIPPSLLISDSLGYVPADPVADVFWYLPSIVCWAGLLVASTRLVLSRAGRHSMDSARARELLEQGGGDTVSFMSTWPQTSYWFDPSGRAAVAYRVQGFIAITVGGPFGPGADDPEVVERFVRHCGDHGLTAAFYSVTDDDRARFTRLGWRSIQVAEEAVLDPTAWTTSGKKWQDIRTAVNRAGKEGLRSEWTRWRDLTLVQQSQIAALSEDWVSEKDLPEMGFTLGGLDELRDDDVRLLLALDEQDRVRAVTSWLPRFERGRVIGYTLDFMRREPDAVNGVMEFLIASAAEWMKADGLTFLSLSGAPLARTGATDGDSSEPLDRLLDDMGARLEPAYGFRSLLAFKRKFQPRFVPLWMIYPDPTDLPAIAIALTRCYIPGLTVRSAARYIRSMRPRERD